VTGKELAAIVQGVKYFRPKLYGRNLKILSDHTPLAKTVNVKDPGRR
jgi:hypothetical protein